MKIISTQFPGLYIIEPEKIKDSRGYFIRMYCKYELKNNGIRFTSKQNSMSYNIKKWTIRGMHYQTFPHAEKKIVYCNQGAIYDVVIDLRTNSPTYKKIFSIELSRKNKKMLLIPNGMAHGYQTLYNSTEVGYLISEYYSPAYAGGIKWNDPLFKINWPHSPSIISKKDMSYEWISEKKIVSLNFSLRA